MSKTTTWANTATKNVRSTSNSKLPSAGSHHVITIRKDNNQRLLKDASNSNNSLTKDKNGYILGGGQTEKRSSGTARNSGGNSKSKAAVGSTMTGAVDKRGGIQQPSAANPKPDDRKVSIEDYYAKQGVNYKILRKTCKLKLSTEGPGPKKDPGIIHLDFFQPPEGYSTDDLPDSQGHASQQHKDDPLSPAVMIAASQKKKNILVTPETDSDEILRRINMLSRRCKKVPERNVGNPKPVDNVITKTPGRDKAGLNDTFPDDSLNDSDLVIASQMVENELQCNSEPEKSTYKDVLKRDINGNSKNPSPAMNPMTSTPLPNLVKNNKSAELVRETPKTTRFTRSRNRSCNQNPTTSHSSLFDNSVVMNIEQELELCVEGDDDTPRKLLKFDESPIKKVNMDKLVDVKSDEQRVSVGEFDEDNEDELFSQLEMPGEIREPKSGIFESSAESEKSAASTQLMDDDSGGAGNQDAGDMDSVMDDAMLEAIAKVEAVHCGSSEPVRNTNSGNRGSRGSLGRVQEMDNTPRRSRRLGLSRSNRRVIV